jgi:hypothetical protein
VTRRELFAALAVSPFVPAVVAKAVPIREFGARYTIAGVYAVNPVTGKSTGLLAYLTWPNPPIYKGHYANATRTPA